MLISVLIIMDINFNIDNFLTLSRKRNPKKIKIKNDNC